MTDTRTIAELAGKTIDEIVRRGWLVGELFEADTEDFELREGYESDNYDEWGDSLVEDVPVVYDLPFKQAVLDNCKVCSLGAMRAAYDGRPDQGDQSDGNGYDNFVAAAADRIYPAWRTATYMHDSTTPLYREPHTVVAAWNDGDLRKEGALDTPSSADDVIRLFRSIAQNNETAKEQS